MTYPKKALVTSSLFHVMTDATYAILPASMPFLATDFSLSYSDIGLLYGLMLGAMVVLQLITGDLADKLNELDLLAGGCLIIAASCILMFYAKSYLELVLLSLVYAAGFSIFHPVSYAMLSRVMSEKDRTKAMGISGSAGDFGNLIAFMSTGAVAAVLGWKASFIGWGILALAASAIYCGAIRHRARPPAPAEESSRSNPSAASGKSSIRLALLVFLLSVFMGAIYRSFMSFGNLLLTDMVQMTPSDSDFVLSTFILSGILGALLSGYIAKYLGLRRSLLMEFLALVPCIFLLYLGVTRTPVTIIALLMVIAFFLYATYPVIYSLAAEVTNFRGRGRSYGVMVSASFLGGSSLSFIGGRLADYTGTLSTVYLLASIIALFGVVVSRALPKGDQGTSS